MSAFRFRSWAAAWLVAVAVPGVAGAAGVEWRPFGGAAFAEARERDLPVFLLLTAPWNRDHFVLVEQLFADPEVATALAAQSVPVRADASVWPELRAHYSISSGLLPSFHFLDAEGHALASLPPLERDELLHFLGQMREAKADPAATGEPGATREMNPKKLADRVARALLDGYHTGQLDVGAAHSDFDPSALAFLVEYCGVYAQRREMLPVVDREIQELLLSPLHDAVDGGFHRALADPAAGVPHYEKLLRPNAELGALLAMRFRMAGEPQVGDAAAFTLRCLNEFLRTETNLYAGSLAADVYSAPGEMALHGVRYYAMNGPSRRRYPDPPASAGIPVGANFALQRSLLAYLHAFREAEMAGAMLGAGEALLRDGFEPDGTARRELARPGRGNLRDQADAGSGLLAYHAVSGDPAALTAAGRIARELLRQFWDEDRHAFRSLSRESDLPALVRDAPPDPAWNGAALRFLADWSAVSGERRWWESASASLAAWAERMPVDPRGIGEIGRAALRAERPLPLLLLVGDPETPEGRELRELILRLFDPLLLVRWIDPAAPEDAGEFGVEPADEPAVYLVWGVPSGPMRDGDALREVFDRVRRQVRR